jgi:hypothetical protein
MEIVKSSFNLNNGASFIETYINIAYSRLFPLVDYGIVKADWKDLSYRDLSR